MPSLCSRSGQQAAGLQPCSVPQIQGVKSVQWVAADADKALELLAGGAAGHLVSMLSPRSPEGELAVWTVVVQTASSPVALSVLTPMTQAGE